MTEGVGFGPDRRDLPLKCRRKQRLTEIEAVHLAQRLSMAGDKMNAYRCPYCDGWHVGHALGGKFSVSADVPESVEAAIAERARLGAELLELQNAMGRIKEDRSQQHWWTAWNNLKAQWNVKRERSAFLKAWIRERAPETNAARHGARAASAIRREAVLTDDLRAFLDAATAAMKAGGADKALVKAFRNAFAVAITDPADETEMAAQRRRFAEQVAYWRETAG